MTITIEKKVLDTIADQAKAHDNLIGLVMEKYNLQGVTHEAFEAMHKGAKTIYMLAMLDGLGM